MARVESQSMALFILFCWAALGAAEPKIANPSFEIDKFGKFPGHARGNGGKITGWTYTGGVGINPWWQDPAGQKGPDHPFSDNGRIPHGRQVALMQNKCTLSQTVSGFEAGKRYIVTYHENARWGNFRPETPPRIQVTLGGETIVSLHPVAPAEERDRRTLPYAFVQSAPFTAPADGSFDLVFTTTVGDRVTILIDNVTIKEVR